MLLLHSLTGFVKSLVTIVGLVLLLTPMVSLEQLLTDSACSKNIWMILRQYERQIHPVTFHFFLKHPPLSKRFLWTLCQTDTWDKSILTLACQDISFPWPNKTNILKIIELELSLEIIERDEPLNFLTSTVQLRLFRSCKDNYNIFRLKFILRGRQVSKL